MKYVIVKNSNPSKYLTNSIPAWSDKLSDAYTYNDYGQVVFVAGFIEDSYYQNYEFALLDYHSSHLGKNKLTAKYYGYNL